jgi:hypothetical protein
MQESGTPHFLLNRSFTDIKQTQQTNSTNKLNKQTQQTNSNQTKKKSKAGFGWPTLM